MQLPPTEPPTATPSQTPPISRGRRKKKSLLQVTRSRILSGLVLIVPFMVTLLAARFFYDLIAGFTEPITRPLYEVSFWERLDDRGLGIIPGLEIVITLALTLLLLYILGSLSTLFVTRRIYAVGEGLLLRIPLLKDVYSLTKQVLDLVASRRQVAFKQVGLVEFPQPGAYVMAFITGESRLSEHPDELYVQVLMPFAPIPTQLILFVFPAAKVHVIDLPMETAMKFLMSGGAVSPGEFRTRPYSSPDPNTENAGFESEEVEFEDEGRTVSGDKRQ